MEIWFKEKIPSVPKKASSPPSHTPTHIHTHLEKPAIKLDIIGFFKTQKVIDWGLSPPYATQTYKSYKWKWNSCGFSWTQINLNEEAVFFQCYIKSHYGPRFTHSLALKIWQKDMKQIPIATTELEIQMNIGTKLRSFAEWRIITDFSDRKINLSHNKHKDSSLIPLISKNKTWTADQSSVYTAKNRYKQWE